MRFDDELTTIKGIGEKTAAAFKKIKVNNVRDLIYTFPRNYLSYDEVVDISTAKVGERVAIKAVISTYVDVRTVRNLKITNITVKDVTGSLKITWFNSPFLKNVLHKGDTYVFVGTVKVKNNMRVMEMPEYYKPEVYKNMRLVMQPVYPLTSGLSNKTFKKTVDYVRPLISSIHDYMPDEVRQECGLMELSKAYDTVHYPVNREQLRMAIKRLAFDEFYKFIADMNKIRVENVKLQNTHKIVQGKAVAEFVETLPYTLTKGQAAAIDDILSDMGSDNVMNRLVQGDVGSGKTVVAAAALLACVKEGFQGALMVPTEVLAKQHFDELTRLFNTFGIHVECLVGSTSLKEKRRIYESISSGNTNVIIGTHALIEDKVAFNNLGLVITDEQHRFGVEQRKRLSDKGVYPHVLVMSATPIPRTLAIIMYADLDISVISELPKGRKPIKNCVVGTGYRNTAYKFIAGQLAEKSQVYVICPMVCDSETLDVTNVTDYTNTLKQALPAEARVEMLHGQMKAADKNAVMEAFLAGDIDVLVSTTVIEVGINNPNATVMMVENAERFGLAQLHQLRGRVGRGNKQSYCIFIDGKESKESHERLQVLENSNDGFYIANEDLKLRGPGDFFGIRQSGEMLFALADIYNHADMLRLAKDMWNKYKATLLDGENDIADASMYVSGTL